MATLRFSISISVITQSILSPGIYNYSIIDANNCTVSDIITIIENKFLEQSEYIDYLEEVDKENWNNFEQNFANNNANITVNPLTIAEAP